MLVFIIRRLLFAIPITIGVTIICFSLVHLAPGDPLSTVMPDNASPQVIEEVRQAYGFDKPLPVQYLRLAEHVATGDFGALASSRGGRFSATSFPPCATR